MYKKKQLDTLIRNSRNDKQLHLDEKEIGCICGDEEDCTCPHIQKKKGVDKLKEIESNV